MWLRLLDYVLFFTIIHDFKHNILLHFLLLKQLFLFIPLILLHLHPNLSLEILFPLGLAVQIVHFKKDYYYYPPKNIQTKKLVNLKKDSIFDR